MKKIVLAVAALAILNAEPVLPMGKHKAMLMEAAGAPGVFAAHEQFPTDYFLVTKNFPTLIGLSLHHPKSSELGLDKAQIDALVALKEKTVPVVMKKAKEIKALELELAQVVGVNYEPAKNLDKKLKKLANLKLELTKAHINCINATKKILTKDQYKTLLSYAGKMPKKDDKFKIDELIFTPHPGKIIKMQGDVLGITAEQKMRIEKEIKGVFAPMVQEKMRRAFELEKQARKMIQDGKTKADLKDTLDEIAKLKRDAADAKIDALNKFKEILTPEQWKAINAK